MERKLLHTFDLQPSVVEAQKYHLHICIENVDGEVGGAPFSRRLQPNAITNNSPRKHQSARSGKRPNDKHHLDQAQRKY